MNKKFLSVSFAAMLTGVAIQAVSASASVQVAPSATVTKKVTICHRTHSVTNPYVRITVAESAIGNGASKHGGVKHDTWSNVLFASKPSPNVFNSAVTYTPATEKKWGDIIPNVYTDGTAFTAAGAGTNYTGIGVDIYNGTNGRSGVCKAMNARDFYEVEKANGVPTQEILDDLEESKDSDEFASALTACGGSFSTCTDPSKLGTTSITIDTTTTTVAGATTTTVAGATPTTVAGGTTTTVAKSTPPATLPAGVTLAAGKGAIAVTIWVDSNRDGSKGTAEKALPGTTVTVKGPNGVTKTATTNADGVVSFVDLDPGSWSVVSVLSASGYEKVYDSDGKLDWESTLTVTAGNVAAASYAAAPALAASATSGTPEASAPTTGAEANIVTTGVRHSGLLVEIALAMVLAGFALTLVRRRRGSSAI